jgi:hypothetical protein
VLDDQYPTAMMSSKTKNLESLEKQLRHYDSWVVQLGDLRDHQTSDWSSWGAEWSVLTEFELAPEYLLEIGLLWS